ncbi:MAG: response regulator, partial [Saprospiraceae bacterium]|nr:response regulator [Saprospiraceae bacterium]
MGNEKIRSLIIDDDQFILDLLRDKLNQCLPEVEVLATAGSGQEGLEQILEYRPDLIFLDVEMADMTGFEMLTRVEHISFQVIFITSYNHYAIKAIRFNALDYLVKPI